MKSGEYDYTLSINNIKNLPFNKYENNFTFHVNGKKYQTNRIIADLLSPTLRNLNFIDQSISEFYINTNDSGNNEIVDDFFQEFLNLATFSNAKIDSQHQKIFSEYFLKLGNTEEYQKMQKDFLKVLTTENVIGILNSIIENSKDIEIQKEIIQFIAAHFESINHEELKSLDIQTLDLIFNNESLILSDEDSLLDFILSLYVGNHEYSVLFEYVQFSNVSENSLFLFLTKFDIEFMNEKIWNSMCNRLLPSKSEFFECQSKRKYHHQKKELLLFDLKEFKYSETEKFNGIMNYLSKKTDGNINDNGTIKITSNSIISDFHPKNLVDYQKNNYYHSKDEGNAIINFDFKDNLIQLSSYSIKTNNSNAFGTHLKNWVIEVSNDEFIWTAIDSHENDSSLNGPNFIANFKIQQKNLDFYRFVRLRQTGNSWYSYCNHNYFILYFIEFFGKIKIRNKDDLKSIVQR